jgi:hypothetical protein
MDEAINALAARYADLLPAAERDRYLADIVIAAALLRPERFVHLAYLMFKTHAAHAAAVCRGG